MEKNEVIKMEHLTKDYGNQKGVFDLSLSVKKGEVFGFLGPNGAGKTTTIRNLMGFIRPGSGSCNINELDCYKHAPKIQKNLGYLAGEIAFLDDLTGKQMLQFVAEMKGMEDTVKMKELIERFELDPRGKIKKMSKGMKQKIGIICAFMDNPDVIILDEPTSGLDPLMQNRFVELVLEEKKKGKTIFMSSHIFEEIEKTCDRTAIIKQGRLISIENREQWAKNQKKWYYITFFNEEEAGKFLTENPIAKKAEENSRTVIISVKESVNDLLQQLAQYKIKDLDIKKETLEERFLHFYDGGDKV